jgi:predicted RNA-binding Zn-ribbon protein involved in translation (DUF1610 family)
MQHTAQLAALKQLDERSQLQAHVESIARDIENGLDGHHCPECDGELSWSDEGHAFQECPSCGEEVDRSETMMTGFDYLSDALDFEYITDSTKNFIGARILVAFGGPNIWINTRNKQVEGHWWGDSATCSYSQDIMDLEGCAEELFNV